MPRLQKVLAEAGIASRRHCEELITEGRVTVDGTVVKALGTRVDPARSTIEVDGEKIRLERKVYWWLHKPPGVISTSRDPQHRTTVLDLLPDLGKRVYSVGRLDEDSTGLLLLTNDGDLAHRLTHPRFGVPKTYSVQVAGRLSSDEIAKIKEGVWIAEGKIRPQQVHRLSVQGQSTWLSIVLKEGKNREIRRLLARLGHKVMQLERTAIGPIKIRQLKRGESRPATEAEIAMLRDLVQKSSEATPVAGSPPRRRSVRKKSGPASATAPGGRRARFLQNKRRRHQTRGS